MPVVYGSFYGVTTKHAENDSRKSQARNAESPCLKLNRRLNRARTGQDIPGTVFERYLQYCMAKSPKFLDATTHATVMRQPKQCFERGRRAHTIRYVSTPLLKKGPRPPGQA